MSLVRIRRRLARVALVVVAAVSPPLVLSERAAAGTLRVTLEAMDRALEFLPAKARLSEAFRHAPAYVNDSRERDPGVPVEAARSWRPAHRPPWLGPPPARARPVVYVNDTVGRRGARWLQYWTFHLDNTQDRGIVRTGRHQGDWELVQFRLAGDGRPDLAVYAQHSWAEACPWHRVQRDGSGAPVVYVANGSHAALFRRGRSDRPWPDPNDEADGAGRRVRPEPVLMRRTYPWVTWPGRWGAARAGLVPGEQSSPRGPLFQAPGRDPDELLDRARPCGSGPPSHPRSVTLGVALFAAFGGLGLARRRRRSRPAT